MRLAPMWSASHEVRNSETPKPAVKHVCTSPAWVAVIAHSRLRVGRLAA